MRGAVALPGSETISRRKGTRRNLGDLAWPAVAKAIPGRDGKARSQSRRGAGEESDGLVVPMKRSNKPVLSGGGGRGGKGPGRREGGRQCMLRTPSRASHVPGVVRLRIGAAGAAQLGMPITSDLRQEPGAGKPHAGICAGAVRNHRPYRDRRRWRHRRRSVHNDRVGWTIEPRKWVIAGAEAVGSAAGNMNGAVMQGAAALPWSKTPSRWKGSRRNLGGLASGRAIPIASVRGGKARSRSRR